MTSTFLLNNSVKQIEVPDIQDLCSYFDNLQPSLVEQDSETHSVSFTHHSTDRQPENLESAVVNTKSNFVEIDSKIVAAESHSNFENTCPKIVNVDTKNVNTDSKIATDNSKSFNSESFFLNRTAHEEHVKSNCPKLDISDKHAQVGDTYTTDDDLIEESDKSEHSGDTTEENVIEEKVESMPPGYSVACYDKVYKVDEDIIEEADGSITKRSDMSDAKILVGYTCNDDVDSSKITQNSKENTQIQYPEAFRTALEHNDGRSTGIEISTTTSFRYECRFEHKINLIQTNATFRKMHLQNEDSVLFIEDMDVTVWQHHELIDFFQNELYQETMIFEMIIQRGDEFIKLEIKNDVIEEDNAGGGVRSRVIHTITSIFRVEPPFKPLMCVKYESESKCRLLKVGSEKCMYVNGDGKLKCEFQETFSDQSYEFRQFHFSAFQKDGRQFHTVSICVFQAAKMRKCITAKGFENVELTRYTVDKSVKGIKHPNPHFFIVTQGDSGSVLESLVIRRSKGRSLFLVWNNEKNKFQLREEALDIAMKTTDFLFKIIHL